LSAALVLGSIAQHLGQRATVGLPLDTGRAICGPSVAAAL